MFTGIIQAIGQIAAMENRNGDMRLTIATGKLDMSDVELGDSIAVNGVCLTAVEYNSSQFVADVSLESLSLTTLGKLQKNSRVNLEKALTLNTRLGGHLVSGHVDGMATVLDRQAEARSEKFVLEAPDNLKRYISHKGSVTIDGTSLTVNEVDDRKFSLNIVPHTIQETIINDYSVGSQVNLEVDVLARYLERLLTAGGKSTAISKGVTMETLVNAGYSDR